MGVRNGPIREIAISLPSYIDSFPHLGRIRTDVGEGRFWDGSQVPTPVASLGNEASGVPSRRRRIESNRRTRVRTLKPASSRRDVLLDPHVSLASSLARSFLPGTHRDVESRGSTPPRPTFELVDLSWNETKPLRRSSPTIEEFRTRSIHPHLRRNLDLLASTSFSRFESLAIPRFELRSTARLVVGVRGTRSIETWSPRANPFR